MPLDTAEANRLADAVHGVATYAAPTGPLKMRLLTANGNGATPGTQVTGGSYTPQTFTAATASGGGTSNSALLRFSGMPACTVTGCEVWDSAGTPRRVYYSSLAAPVVVTAGQALEFAAGAATFAFA